MYSESPNMQVLQKQTGGNDSLSRHGKFKRFIVSLYFVAVKEIRISYNNLMVITQLNLIHITLLMLNFLNAGVWEQQNLKYILYYLPLVIFLTGSVRSGSTDPTIRSEPYRRNPDIIFRKLPREKPLYYETPNTSEPYIYYTSPQVGITLFILF